LQSGSFFATYQTNIPSLNLWSRMPSASIMNQPLLRLEWTPYFRLCPPERNTIKEWEATGDQSTRQEGGKALGGHPYRGIATITKSVASVSQKIPRTWSIRSFCGSSLSTCTAKQTEVELFSERGHLPRLVNKILVSTGQICSQEPEVEL
jgi:hypothetical protein